jgi:hypothetical protein
MTDYLRYLASRYKLYSMLNFLGFFRSNWHSQATTFEELNLGETTLLLSMKPELNQHRQLCRSRF